MDLLSIISSLVGSGMSYEAAQQRALKDMSGLANSQGLSGLGSGPGLANAKNQLGGGVQAVSTCAPSVMIGTFCASMAYFPGASQADPNFFQYHNQSSEQLEANRKKHLEAEETAKNFIVNVLGEEQAEVYNRSMRVILKPGKHFWVIGDVNRSYHEQDPFVGKPDVIRIDNQDKLHYTSFCVDQRGGGPTPYTDKVVSFAIHCFNDEKSFIKTINRIREDTLKEMPECAVLK